MHSLGEIQLTSSSFVTLWEARVELVSHKGCKVRVPWAIDAATDGEIRITALNNETDELEVEGAANGENLFNWLHGAELGSGPIMFRIQARVTSGAGEIHVYEPTGLHLIDPTQCTTGGLVT